MSIKLIIFDFDGTLGDTRRNIVTTMQMAIKELQLPERSEAEWKEAKPKPEPVLKTLAAMQFAANETLVVGDMAVDILMGYNAGAKTCGVTWGNGSREELKEAGADFIIDRMEDLLGVTSTNIIDNTVRL